jgi:hypothetical protein
MRQLMKDELWMNREYNKPLIDRNMKTCSETYQFEKDLKWENPAPGVNRQIMAYDGQLMMVKVKFDKGAVGSMHEHYHSQATYVVSGKFELTIGDKKEILSAGDGYYVAPDELHGCVCLEAGILIDTFSPVRADFLNL